MSKLLTFSTLSTRVLSSLGIDFMLSCAIMKLNYLLVERVEDGPWQDYPNK